MKIKVLDVLLNTIDKVKRFTNIANKFDCDVDVIQGKYTVDGRSILGIFSLNLTDTVTVEIENDNERYTMEIKQFNIENTRRL